MGMFDTVTVKCSCGRELSFQSKSGPCNLDVYTLDDAPHSVIHDVNRHAPVECPCSNLVSVDIGRRTVVIDSTKRIAALEERVKRLEDGPRYDAEYHRKLFGSGPE